MKGKRIAAIAAVGAASAVVVGLATGAIPGSGGVIDGCYLKAGGVLRVIDADRGQKCTRLETPLTWSQQGAQGPQGPQGLQGPQGSAGTFSGTFESPSKQYSLSITDSGIELAGPSGSVEIDGAGIEIDGAGPVSINGALVQLNGCTRPVARAGDPVTGTAAGGDVNGTIAGGSPTVCTGGTEET